MKIAAVQLNSKIADLEGNLSKALKFYRESSAAGCDMAVFPELSVCGYPPLDLLDNPDFIKACERKAEEWAAMTKNGPACIFGAPIRNPSAKGKGILNCAIFASGGLIKKVTGKTLLPVYDIFDEARHFEPWKGGRIVSYRGEKFAITVCEDIWAGTSLLPRKELYRENPLLDCVRSGADFVINISASPFYKNKGRERKNILSALAKKRKIPILYVNCCGANDELVFDGETLFFSKEGKLLKNGPAFAESCVFIDSRTSFKKSETQPRDYESDIRKALVLGIRDYFFKQGFKKAAIGLSGGIDSAVVACLAAEALGAQNVLAVLMPSPYTSKQSIEDALLLAKNLGIRTKINPISAIYDSFIKELGYNEKNIDLAKQNLQSRIRGCLLMAHSNREGCLVLTTGNKSEIAMGYCTLYGDTAGALAPIGDLLKTEVYSLAQHINCEREIIPRSIILRPPTAELKPGQKDQDDLPPYDKLDKIIRAYIEDSAPFSSFPKKERDLAEKIIRRLEINEYKRKQLPMCIKISKKSFGSGRKMPVSKLAAVYK